MNEPKGILRPSADELRVRLGGVLLKMQNAPQRDPVAEEAVSEVIDAYDEALSGLIYEADRHIPEVFAPPETLDEIERRALSDRTHWSRGARWALQRIRRALNG